MHSRVLLLLFVAVAGVVSKGVEPPAHPPTAPTNPTAPAPPPAYPLSFCSFNNEKDCCAAGFDDHKGAWCAWCVIRGSVGGKIFDDKGICLPPSLRNELKHFGPTSNQYTIKCMCNAENGAIKSATTTGLLMLTAVASSLFVLLLA
eukprot:TRINITY_DN68146_c9_g7_i3.p1 TRINITY_DN68146_c9_g7~~TRINITY_DN68146_c9_g7_i3.p1  ORF type:complete len:146 (+),score=19.24 TRINITY_DN68146_c9_g7_i3:36-473(+)